MAPGVADHLESDFRHAEEARRAGHFAQALDEYCVLLARRIALFNGEAAARRLTAADLVVLERAADLAVLFGYDEAADHLLDAMATALESAQNLFGTDYTLAKRVHLALSFGRLRDARRLLRSMSPRIGDIESINFTDEGFAVWESSCRWNDVSDADRFVIFSRLYLAMGWLLTSLGQYGDALSALKRGLSFTETRSPQLAQKAAVPLRLLIATACLERGDLETGRRWLTELESSLSQKRQPGFYVRYRELSGKLKMLRGDFGGALVEYLAVLDCCQSNAFTRAALAATLNLANVLIFLNNTSVARQLLLVSQAQAAESNDQATVARAECLLALAAERGASMRDNGSVAPSVSAMRGSIIGPIANFDAPQPAPEIPQAESFLAFFEDRALDFFWQLNNHDFALAAQVSRQLRATFGRSDSKLILAKLQVLEGISAYYLDDFTNATRLLQDSVPTLRQLGLMPDLWQTQRILGWCWARLGFPKMQRQELANKNQQLLSAMTSSLPSEYQAIFLLNKWTDEEEFIAGEIDQLLELKARRGVWYKRPWRYWSLMKRIYELLQYVDHHKASLASEGKTEGRKENQAPSVTSLWRFLWAQPRGRATISFLVLPDRVLVVCSSRGRLDFDVCDISRIQVRDLVKRWHLLVNGTSSYNRGKSPQFPQKALIGVDYLDSLVTGARNLIPFDSTGPDESLERAAEVAAELAARLKISSIVEKLPARVRALTIVPHDSLLGFPFSVIPYKNDYLIKRLKVNVEFEHFAKTPPKRRRPGGKALFIGVSQGTNEFSPLPGVSQELNEFEHWCSKRGLPFQSLMNEAATKSVVLEKLTASSLIHIACHGFFSPDQPDASGLVLVPGANHVDILSLRDLSKMSLRTLKHVSLSSCWSADNFILPGRWIIGLPETLRRAGVHSILACLWEVNDRFASSFAARFYDYLNTCPRDEALRRTQLDCLKQEHSGAKVRQLDNVENINTAEPFYWASYILCGDYHSLDL